VRAKRWKHLVVCGCLAILAAGALASGGDEPRTGRRDASPTRGPRIDVVRTEWERGRSVDAPAEPVPAVTVVAAGDLSCDPTNEMFNAGHGTRRWCRAEDTEALIQRIDPDIVIPLGDTQYDEGRLAAFRASYALHWGLERWRSRPVVGNHEYLSSPDAHGYFMYFGPEAGPPGKGWYSYDAGAWHVVALNSNCMLVRCDRSSRQYRWLADDLEASPGPCTLVSFHHARFSSGPHGDDPELLLLRPIWRLLYRRGVDLVVNAHDHIYERFAPMDPGGHRDPEFGTREFIVGTGGAEHYWIERVRYASQVRDVDTFGVLRLSLGDGGYAWAFEPIDGFSFTDQGSGTCHGAPSAKP